MKRAIIISINNFPDGDAGSVRQYYFAKIFEAIGYKPIVISYGESTNFDIKKYNNIEYISLRFQGTSFCKKIMSKVMFNMNLKKILKKLNSQDIYLCLIVSGNLKTFKIIEKYALTNQILLLHDSVEWYSPCEFSNGEKNHNYKYNNTLNTKIINKNYSVFSISNYLHNYFSSSKIRSIRVPVLMDTSNISVNKTIDKEKICIIYAGQLGNKDYLYHVIEAIKLLDLPLRRKIIFNVFGCYLDEYVIKHGELSDGLEKCICFHGRVKRSKVLEGYQNADFSILVRPTNERYAKAGFPTKVVESLATGTPVITNLSSDINLYLRDEKNGIIIAGDTILDVKNALERALKSSYEKRIEMQMEARNTAEKFFDYRLYIEKIEEFLTSGKNKTN